MQPAATAFPPYDFYSTGQLLEAYRLAPGRLRSVVAGLAPGELQARPVAGKWSILEIARHVADSELVGAVRVRMVTAQPGVQLPGYNQDLWTARLRHNDADPALLEETLGLFAHLRAVTGRIFAAARGDDWGATGTHPEYGDVSLRNLLELYADHGERHIEQILERRALLGRRMEMAILLPRRLY
jgi:hypothetical protein